MPAVRLPIADFPTAVGPTHTKEGGEGTSRCCYETTRRLHEQPLRLVSPVLYRATVISFGSLPGIGHPSHRIPRNHPLDLICNVRCTAQPEAVHCNCPIRPSPGHSQAPSPSWNYFLRETTKDAHAVSRKLRLALISLTMSSAPPETVPRSGTAASRTAPIAPLPTVL